MKSKFKIGDRVKVSKRYQSSHNCCGLGTVKDIETYHKRTLYIVRFDNKNFDLSLYSYQLDKVEEQLKAKPKYNVGDKVILTTKAIKWLEKNYKGKTDYSKVYEIIECQDTSFVITAKGVEHNPKRGYYLDGVYDVVFYEDDLEPAPLPIHESRSTDVKPETLDTLKIYTGDWWNKQRQNKWKDICNEYLRDFCNKHEYRYEPDMWIGNDPGTIVEVNDMVVSIDDIRYDLDNNIPEPVFETWYWKSIEVYELSGQKYMNYPSYCKGAPDEWTEERMNKLRQASKRVQEARKVLDQELENFKRTQQLF